MLYRATGVVLRTIKLGEADRIITLCTPDRGKVRAVAKGVRKTKSRFGGRLEPVSHVALQCYEGHELDTVTQVESVDGFRAIREDFDRLRRAIAMLEAVDNLSQPGETNPRLYQMLVGALRTLEDHDSVAIVGSFYFKLLAFEGVRPVVESCATCGRDTELVAFDAIEGGLLCRGCRRGIAVSQQAVELIRRVLGGDMVAVLKEEAGPATFEMVHVADEALEAHLERRMRSRRLLDHA